ncbi:hypothetical protein COU60_00215 [Candidatus Pacearchaeota archaeon CG10_big_fil_rev_8_21_14_0_10_34_76]|nr:MAG: hypothetical protein COU60_00215 [Candidatus Pacearchaeota archaeon CG10_big_fil_rev_8_21_14_0_10_34_76]
MNKTIWMNVLISAIVAVIVFSLMSMIGPSIGLSPGLKTIDEGKIINANSCNADEICEMRRGEAESIMSPGNQTLKIGSDNAILLSGDIIAYDLAGNGTAYVCTTFKGSVYRSSTPCV